ncbi:P-loop containing nucleoside triphosphate hydrolase protein [Hypoxylon sp. FL1284]|nr:P-loop containing nucleoside triphosphate hydrolase protein [Hypoxylon sp. FL1284]
MFKMKKKQRFLLKRKIDQIVDQCPGISRETAEEYLKASQNDVQKAIAKYKISDHETDEVESQALTPKTDTANVPSVNGEGAATKGPSEERVTAEPAAPGPVVPEPTAPEPTASELISSEPTALEPTAEEPEVIVTEPEPIAPEPVDESPKPAVDNLQQYASLPRFSPPEKSLTQASHSADGVSIEGIIGAVQNGYSANDLYDLLSYLKKRDGAKLREGLNSEIGGFPAIFFIVETNDADLIRLWINFGGNPNATHGPRNFPLLIFAILRGIDSRLRATRTIETLLRLGASPHVVPAMYYEPFDSDLYGSWVADEDSYVIADDTQPWCTLDVRRHLVTALSLTQRYRLWQASKLSPVSGREQTLVLRKGADEILGLQQTIIGQSMAAYSLRKSFFIHLAVPSRKPLVLLFAGPKGHGKSELANRLGYLLSSELANVDCADFNYEDELFGPKQPHQGYDIGSSLNNFLARNSGRRSIVFMNEFERFDETIRSALLLPFDQGEYIDRRNARKIDCSKTIWILATNKFDGIIHDMCVGRRETSPSPNLGPEDLTLRRQLCHRLLKESMTSFGASLACRISEVIPFLAFSKEEQALLADRCIMEMEERIAAPVVKATNPDEDQLVGNVHLQISDNAAVCSHIADNYYIPELGARSISRGVDATITNPLVNWYLEDGDDFAEDQAHSHFRVGANKSNEVLVWPVTRTLDSTTLLELS